MIVFVLTASGSDNPDYLNNWLGGDGDQWEQGPYWIDGLLPLAYILDDQNLKEKIQPWIEWTLNSQRADGYFGPETNYSNEPGLQRNNCDDWWPCMVMLKILQQYYSAKGDNRVITLMEKYFRFQIQDFRFQIQDFRSQIQDSRLIIINNGY